VKALFFSVSVLTLVATNATAQQLPQPAPPTPAIAAAQDIPYPGVLKLSVDATDLDRKIFHPRDDARRQVRSDDHPTIPNGCPAVTRRATTSTRWPAW
jgi:hypothetical protein